MNSEDLIKKLSSEHKKVKPLMSLKKRLFIWLSVAILCLGAGISSLGLREDWRIVFDTPSLLAQNIILIFSILSAATAALVLSVPGNENNKWLKLFSFLPIFLWLLLLLFGNFQSHSFYPGSGLSCIRDIIIFGSLPAVALFIIVKMGASLATGLTGLLSVVAASGVGIWALQFTCHNDSPAHLLIWHFLPMIFLSFIGVRIGRSVLK